MAHTIKRWSEGIPGGGKILYELQLINLRKEHDCNWCGKVLFPQDVTFCLISTTIRKDYSGEWTRIGYPSRTYYCIDCGYSLFIEEEPR